MQNTRACEKVKVKNGGCGGQGTTVERGKLTRPTFSRRRVRCTRVWHARMVPCPALSLCFCALVVNPRPTGPFKVAQGHSRVSGKKCLCLRELHELTRRRCPAFSDRAAADSPSTVLRPPSPPLGEKAGMRGRRGNYRQVAPTELSSRPSRDTMPCRQINSNANRIPAKK